MCILCNKGAIMKKILCVASTASHISNFHMPYINALSGEPEKYKVLTMANANGKGGVDFDICFHKKMFSLKNLKATKQIEKILRDENFDVVFLNTSLASFFVRLAIKKLKNKPKVINIVHGYLFDKNTGFAKKTLLSTAEKFTRNVTNHIITMNQEDFVFASEKKLSKNEVHFINGMGIQNRTNGEDLFSNDISNGFEFTFIGELSGRKNQGFLIKFIKRLSDENINARLNLVGEGSSKDEYQKLAKKLKIEDKINFCGYTKDISAIFKRTNFYVSASKIEGLPFNIVEAMNAGQIVISADAKGCVDLIQDQKNGMLFKMNDMDDFVSKFKMIKDDISLQNKMRIEAKKTAKKYLIDAIFDENEKLFESLINSKE